MPWFCLDVLMTHKPLIALLSHCGTILGIDKLKDVWRMILYQRNETQTAVNLYILLCNIPILNLFIWPFYFIRYLWLSFIPVLDSFMNNDASLRFWISVPFLFLSIYGLHSWLKVSFQFSLIVCIGRCRLFPFSLIR